VAKADLINEISVLSRLRHPNVRGRNFVGKFVISLFLCARRAHDSDLILPLHTAGHVFGGLHYWSSSYYLKRVYVGWQSRGVFLLRAPCPLEGLLTRKPLDALAPSFYIDPFLDPPLAPAATLRTAASNPPPKNNRAGPQDYLIGKRKDRGGKPWQPPPKLVLQWSVELARCAFARRDAPPRPLSADCATRGRGTAIPGANQGNAVH
jgi:hypothetical protein